MDTATFLFNQLLGPILVASLLITALFKILSLTEKMSGDFGAAASKYTSMAMGLATGGAAMLGRGFVGTAAKMALKGGALEEGGTAHKAATWATRASFDVRNLGGKDSIFGATIGGGIEKSIGSLGIGKGGGVGGVEKKEKDKIEKELKAAERSKVSIFEEQGIRARAAEEVGIRKEQAAAAETLASAATELTTQLKASAEAAQKEHDESPEAKERDIAGAAYEEAVRDRMRGGSPEAVDKAKAAFDKAESNHASSPTALAAKNAVAAVERAKKAEKDAWEAAKEAKKRTEGKDGKERSADDIAKEEIDRANKIRKDISIEKAERKGRYVTAAKIRKGEGSESKKDKLAKLAKEIAEEEAGDKKEEKEEKETGGGEKH